MTRLIARFTGGLVVSLVFGFAAFLLSTLFSLFGVEINFGGCKSNVFIALFFGLPLGSVFGFVSVDKAIFKSEKYHILGLIIGSTTSMILGGISSVLLLDAVGGTAIFFVPVVVVSIALAGYYAGIRLGSRKMRVRSRGEM